MKKYILYGILLAYFVGCAIIINNGLHDIRVSSFKIGCMNVKTSIDIIEECKNLAEEKVGR